MNDRVESIDFRTQKQIREDRRARREAGLRQTRPARVARLLALAHAIERQIQAGEIKDYADVARRHGFTRARVSQVMNLLLLAPDIQEEILGMVATPGREPVTERHLREVVKTVVWGEQRLVWSKIARRSACDFGLLAS
jgi:hypothetical protein